MTTLKEAIAIVLQNDLEVSNGDLTLAADTDGYVVFPNDTEWTVVFDSDEEQAEFEDCYDEFDDAFADFINKVNA